VAKTNLTKKNYRSKRRSCALCKPQKMHGADSRTSQLQRESIGHEQQLQELALAGIALERPALVGRKGSGKIIPAIHNSYALSTRLSPSSSLL